MVDEMIWVLGDLAARALPLVLWTLASVGVVLLVGVGGLVRKGRRSGQIAGDDLGEPEPADSDATDAPRTFDLRIQAAPASDRKSFRDGLKQISKAMHLKSPYQIPWFLVLGQELGGKTTALASSRLDNPLGEPDTVRPGLQWWYYDRAQLLDVPGAYVLDEVTTTSDRSAWFGLLSLLRRYRSRRPADSILLVIPASELVDYDDTDEAAQRNLLWRCELLRRKLWQAQERLGMRLPVYVVVSKSDRIDGYDAFFASVPRSAQRQMFGWSNPEGPDAEYSPSLVEDAFGSLDLALARHEDRLVASEPRSSGPEPLDVLAFRQRLGRLQAPLQLALDQIFVTGALYEPFPLRGLYLTGGTGFARGAHHAEPDTHPQVSFIDDLLSWKVFYEWSLGRATRVASERAGRRRGLFSALCALLAIVGPALVLWGQAEVSQRAENVAERFYQPAADYLKQRSNDPTEEPLPIARRLLQAGTPVESYRLQSLLLPTSYLMPFRAKANQAGERAMREIILPGIRDELDLDIAQARGQLQGRSGPSRVLTNMESTVEYQSMAAAERRLELVESGAADYECIVQPCSTNGQRLRQRMTSLAFKSFEVDWQPPSYGADRYYTWTLRRSAQTMPSPWQAVEPYQPCQEESNAMAGGFKVSMEQMFNHLFGSNQLINADLAALQSGIDNLVKEPRSPEETREAFDEMIDAITLTERHLSRPDVAWAGRVAMTLGPRYNRLLEQLQDSCFLGEPRSVREELVGGLDQYGQNLYVDFRRGLKGFSTRTTGPLLKRNGDGEPLLLLSEGVLDLQSILKTFVNDQQGTLVPLQIPEIDQTVSWDTVELDRAKSLLSRFETFIEQSSSNVDTYDLVAMLRPDIDAQVLSRVARAQRVSPRPRLREDRELVRQGLRTEVDNLTSVSDALTEILDGLGGVNRSTITCGDDLSPYCRLAEAIEEQKFNILSVLTELLDEEAPYRPEVPPHELVGPGEDREWIFLSTWDGTTNPAFDAFDVRTTADLELYVERQLEIVEELDKKIAGPTLRDAVPSTPDAWGRHETVPYRIWDEVSEELTKLADKTPGNSPAALSSFILDTMSGLRVDSCAEAGFEVSSSCPVPTQTFVEMCRRCDCDIFQARRRQLQSGLGERCDELAVLAGLDAWKTLGNAFANRLEGKYPFVEPSPPPGVDETLLDDLASFLATYAAQRGAIEGLLSVASQCSSGVDASLQPAADFLATLDGVSTFFAGWMKLRETAPSTAPAFGLQVEFRTNRGPPPPGHELGGQYILRWSFDIGLDTVAIEPGTVDVQPLWTYPEPVTLALRWALNAPVRPIHPTHEPFATLDGLTVKYDYTNAWSLLRLIGDHPTPALRLPPGGATAVPRTLEFRVPTVDRTDATTDTGKITEFDPKFSRVYVRLTLTDPENREQELAVPVFPSSVPQLPKAVLDDTTGDICAVLGGG